MEAYTLNDMDTGFRISPENQPGWMIAETSIVRA